MNFPMMPGQNSKGIKGANVVSVPAKTGTNTSPAAYLAASTLLIFPFPCEKILCVFSITTMASSTTIPKPNKSANSTMKLSVTLDPTMNSAEGSSINARNMLNGTESATKKELVTPIKNMRIIITRINPITIEFTNSSNAADALMLRSPVMLIFKSFGSTLPCISSTILLIFSDALIRFSPERLMILRVTTFLPFKRA